MRDIHTKGGKYVLKRNFRQVIAMILTFCMIISGFPVSAADEFLIVGSKRISQIVYQTGFEEGTDGFTGRGNARVAVTTEDKHSGDRSLKVTGRSSSWHGTIVEIPDVISGGEYELNAWVKLVDAAEAYTIQASVDLGNSWPQFDGSPTEVEPGEWVNIKGTYKATASGVLKVYFEIPDSTTASFYVDDFTLTQIGGPTSTTESTIKVINEEHQTYEGMGAAVAFNHAFSLREFYESDDLEERALAEKIMDMLFDDETGVGFDIVRIIVGSGGVTNNNPDNPYGYGNYWYDGPSDTIEPLEGVYVWDSAWTPEIAWEDEKESFDEDQIWFAKMAQDKYGVDTIYACAWTAPYWMKQNESVTGSWGKDLLKTDKDENGRLIYYQAYAEYLVNFALHYAKDFGVHITHLGPTNESESTHSGYDGMVLSGDDYATFIADYLGPELEKRAHEFEEIGAPVPKITGPEGTNLGASTGNSYSGAMSREDVQQYMGTFSTHMYGSANQLEGGPQTVENGKWPEWIENYGSIWQTEYMNQTSTTSPTTANSIYKNNIIDDATYYANLICNAFNSEPGYNAWLWWWFIANNGADGSDIIRWANTGTVQTDPETKNTETGEYRVFKRYYGLGQFSRFLDSGDVRLGIEIEGNVNATAFRDSGAAADNKDYKVIVVNNGSNDQEVTVSLKDLGVDGGSVVGFRTSASENQKKLDPIEVDENGEFTFTLPSKSIVTFLSEDDESADLPGLDDSRDTFSSLEAEDNEGLTGAEVTEEGNAVSASDGDTIVFENINFADGSVNGSYPRKHVLSMEAIAASDQGGIIELHVDSEDGPLVGSFTIPAGDGESFDTYYTQINTGDKAAYGHKDLYVVFRGIEGSTITVDRFDFNENYIIDNNLIENGSFQSNVNSWVVASGSEDAELSRTQDQAYSDPLQNNGNNIYGAVVSSGTDGIAQDVTDVIQDSGTYYVGGFFMSEDTVNASIQLDVLKDGDVVEEIPIATRELNEPIQKFSDRTGVAPKRNVLMWTQVDGFFTFKTTKDYDQLKLVLTADTSSDLYIDEVSLIPYFDRGALIDLLNENEDFDTTGFTDEEIEKLNTARENALNTVTDPDADWDNLFVAQMRYVNALDKISVPVESIEVEPSELILTVGKTATLEVSLLPLYADSMEVEWTTSDPDVAIVYDGIVVGISKGTATITATADGGKTATAKVTVRNEGEADPLQDIYEDYFMMGNIYTSFDVNNASEFRRENFNVITFGNEMKPDALGPSYRQTNFSNADRMLDIVTNTYGQKVHGHVLVWHSQTPGWFNTGETGGTRDKAKANMEWYIKEVVEHFGDKVISWDVVNEAFTDSVAEFPEGADWQDYLRGGPNGGESNWYKAYSTGMDEAAGETPGDFIYDAFVFARKYAPEGMPLIYNDFNLYQPGKRDAVAAMVKDLNARYAEEYPEDTEPLISAVGMQSHNYMIDCTAELVEEAIRTFVDAGVDVVISELDLFCWYPYNSRRNTSYTDLSDRGTDIIGTNGTDDENNYWINQGVTNGAEIEKLQAERYAEFFMVYKKYADHIDRVTFWGDTDTSSWRSYMNPLILNSDGSPKEAYWAVVDPEGYLNVIHTADFEEGTDGFGKRGGETVATSTEEAFRGKSSLKISNRSSSWNGPKVDLSSSVEPGSEYEFSAWLKLGDDCTAEDITVSAEVKVNGSTQYVSAEETEVLAEIDGWIKVAGRLTIPEGATSAAFYLETSADAASASFYMDDVVIRKTLDASEQPIDKTELEELIEEAEALTSSDYTAETWSAVEAALAVAKYVYDDESATEDEVADAAKTLTDAIEALEEVVPIVVDKAALKEQIDKAEALNSEDYTAESWSTVEAALAVAKYVYDDENASEEKVTEASKALIDAMEALEEEVPVVVDKTELKEQIDRAKALNSKDYTAESWSNLKNALTVAEYVYNNANATENEVVGVTTALNKAIEDLEKVSSEPVESPKLSAEKLSIRVGSSKTLSIENLPEGEKVVWSSSNTNIATVDENGVVKAVSRGTAEIRAQIGEEILVCDVTVTKRSSGGSSGGSGGSSGGVGSGTEVGTTGIPSGSGSGSGSTTGSGSSSDLGGYLILDTLVYTMAPNMIYDIGYDFKDMGCTLKVYSSRPEIASVEQLPNGNYRVTGLSNGTTFIMFEIYDTNGMLVNHASTRIVIADVDQGSGIKNTAASIF